MHFWPSLLFMNGVFMPMFIQGLAGVSRRLWDGGLEYAHASGVFHLNEFMSISAWLLGLAQIPFIINVFYSIFRGEKVDNNPWQATTLEWLRHPRHYLMSILIHFLLFIVIHMNIAFLVEIEILLLKLNLKKINNSIE